MAIGSGLVRVTLSLPLAMGSWSLVRRSGSLETRGCGRRWSAVGHGRLDLSGQAHEISHRSARLDRRPHQSNGLGARHTHRGECASDL
jgi:hypothetical protein